VRVDVDAVLHQRHRLLQRFFRAERRVGLTQGCCGHEHGVGARGIFTGDVLQCLLEKPDPVGEIGPRTRLREPRVVHGPDLDGGLHVRDRCAGLTYPAGEPDQLHGAFDVRPVGGSDEASVVVDSQA
jgi:hypothetical protein